MNAYAGVLFLPGASSRQKVPAREPIVKATSTPPQAIETPLTERNRVRAALIAAGHSLPAGYDPDAVIRMLDEWAADESGEQETTWKELKTGLDAERERLGMRKLFNG